MGSDVADYARKKHTGGKAGNKGTRYEDHYAVFRVVQLSAGLLTGSNVDPSVTSQVVGLVDDLRLADNDSTEYYQLKNKQEISWTSGDHPLCVDFANQFSLSTHLNEPGPVTSLVVPCADKRATLEQGKPEEISSHTKVHYFPWVETVNRLVIEHQDLRYWLVEISNVEDPTDDVLVGAYCALLAAFVNSPDGANVSELLASAAKMYPGQIRLSPQNANWGDLLDDSFKTKIDRIPGLMYVAARGFFRWEAFDTSGVFPFDLTSVEFKEFQRLVVTQNPQTFDEFEELLP